MTAPERITLTAHDSLSAGSCCFCDRYTWPATGRTVAHTVYIVSSSRDGGGLMARFCAHCLHDLLRLAEGL